MNNVRSAAPRWDVWLSGEDEWPTFLGTVEAESYDVAEILARLTYGLKAVVSAATSQKLRPCHEGA
jgi:hypothetical protein